MPLDKTVHLRDLWAVVVVVVGLVDLDEAELDGEDQMGGMYRRLLLRRELMVVGQLLQKRR